MYPLAVELRFVGIEFGGVRFELFRRQLTCGVDDRIEGLAIVLCITFARAQRLYVEHLVEQKINVAAIE